MLPLHVDPTMEVVTSIPGPQDLTQYPGPLSGQVMDVAGNPVANAWVDVKIHTPNVPLNTIGYSTNAEGHYNLYALRSADYTVTILAEGYYSETKAITIVEGVPETLDFVLRPIE